MMMLCLRISCLMLIIVYSLISLFILIIIVHPREREQPDQRASLNISVLKLCNTSVRGRVWCRMDWLTGVSVTLMIILCLSAIPNILVLYTIWKTK